MSKQLVYCVGTMNEVEQALHDLDMVRLFCQIDPDLTEAQGKQFLLKYLCTDPKEITERSALLGELKEKCSLETMARLHDLLAALPEDRRKLEQASDRLHTLLYQERLVSGYLEAIGLLVSIGDAGIESSRLKEICGDAKLWVREDEYLQAQKALIAQREQIIFPGMVSVGFNMQNGARPSEVSILSAGEQRESNPLIGARQTSKEANSLFPPMTYHRAQYGTHFEEYLTEALEKEWRPRLSRAMDCWKKVSFPHEEALKALIDDTAFYVLGLKMIRLYEEKQVHVVRPECSGEVLIGGEDLLYPELLLKNEHVHGNAVSLRNDESVIITGANHSGKTSFLKTLGQNLLLAQLGFFAVARSLTVRPVRSIYTLFSAGEDDGMRSSRMGIEIRLLAQMLEKAGSEDLVLINEPLTSTNPLEAISICADLLRRFLETGVPCLMVTHLYDVYFLLDSTLKDDLRAKFRSLVTVSHFEEHKGMVYAYSLMESEPLGNSYARETAESYGITLEKMIPSEEILDKGLAFCRAEEKQSMYSSGGSHGLTD